MFQLAHLLPQNDQDIAPQARAQVDGDEAEIVQLRVSARKRNDLACVQAPALDA
jgi:hypothetical protein